MAANLCVLNALPNILVAANGLSALMPPYNHITITIPTSVQYHVKGDKGYWLGESVCVLVMSVPDTHCTVASTSV